MYYFGLIFKIKTHDINWYKIESISLNIECVFNLNILEIILNGIGIKRYVKFYYKKNFLE